MCWTLFHKRVYKKTVYSGHLFLHTCNSNSNRIVAALRAHCLRTNMKLSAAIRHDKNKAITIAVPRTRNTYVGHGDVCRGPKGIKVVLGLRLNGLNPRTHRISLINESINYFMMTCY